VKQKVLAITFIIVVAVALFTYTVRIRSPWFGYYSGENHDWLTASTLIFTENWDREGAWNLKFGMYDDPKSPEFPSLLDRSPYISYPPGAAMPIFTLSQLSGQPPSLDLIMGYNLANHLLIAIVLALIVFFFLDGLGLDVEIAVGFALLPVFLELLLPAPLYFHQNSFFSDQAVLLPFALVVLMEVLRGQHTGRTRTIISMCQGLVFLYGMWTDWLFVFVVIAFFIKRILAGEIPLRDRKALITETAKLWTLPLAAIAAFFFYVYLIEDMNLYWTWFQLRYKFFVRSGADDPTSRWDMFRTVTSYVDLGYGYAGRVIIYSSVVLVLALSGYIIVQKLRRMAVERDFELVALLAFIITVPCVLQIATFLNHSSVHNFSVLKLTLPISVVAFVLLPLLAGLAARHLTQKENLARIMFIILVPAILLTGVYLALVHRGYTDYFHEKNAYWYKVVDATNLHDQPNDIVFSNTMELPDKPPQLLSLTMKRVYRVGSVKDILKKLDKAQGDYRVMLILTNNQPGSGNWSTVKEAADSVLQDANGYTYVFFSPESIRKLKS